MKKRALCTLLAALMLCLPLSGCALFQNKVEDLGEAEAAPYYALTDQFLGRLFAEDYASCYAMLGENLQNTMTLQEMQDAWEQTRLTWGDPVEVDARKPYRINGEGTVVSQVVSQHGGCSIQLTFDKNDKVAGLWFGLRETPVSYAVAVPQGVKEERLTLSAGTPYALEAILTLPEGAEGQVPAVVLVHGSGASDRNEAVGGCTPFADLAHGLAQKGIASIRYDKRTYTYGDSYTQEEINAMTVKEEVIDDALAAVDALYKDARIDQNGIVLVGHSLGGMLAPRIAASTDKIKGVVSLAGTARGYLDLVYDQNMALTANASQQNTVKKEYRKLDNLMQMKDSATLFGIPVPYLKDLYAHPVEESLQGLDIPFLILQGKRDFQVSLADYKSWQEALKDYSGGAQFELFENLNHLFVDNSGFKRRGTVAEYLQEGHVAQEVIDKIASWMGEALPAT